MTTPITVDWVSGNGFVARYAAGRVGRGWSPQEAWDALRGASETNFQPIRASAVVKPPPGREGIDPWMQWVGTLDPNDLLVQSWEQSIAEHRRQLEREASIEPLEGTSGAA